MAICDGVSAKGIFDPVLIATAQIVDFEMARSCTIGIGWVHVNARAFLGCSVRKLLGDASAPSHRRWSDHVRIHWRSWEYISLSEDVVSSFG